MQRPLLRKPKHLGRWTRSSFGAVVISGLLGCATQIVAFDAKGFEYNLWFATAYLDESKIVLEAPPNQNFRGHHATIDLKALRWYPATLEDRDIPIHRSLNFYRGPPETRPSEARCVPLTPGKACAPGAPASIVVTQTDGSTATYRLSLSRSASGDIKTVVVVRAETTDGVTALTTKAAPERGGSPWARLFYPLALTVDAVSLPFLVFVNVAASH